MDEMKNNQNPNNCGAAEACEGNRNNDCSQSNMSELDRERQMAELIEDNDVVIAHIYDRKGYSEFLFHKSPENIANFIGARPFVSQIVLADQQENPFLWTIGYFIDRCPDKVLLEEVKKVLIPIQMGEAEARPIFSPSIGEVVAYLMRPTTGGADK